MLVCPPLPIVAPPFLAGAGAGFFLSPAPPATAAAATVVVDEADDVRDGAGGAVAAPAAFFLAGGLAGAATAWGESSSVSSVERRGRVSFVTHHRGLQARSSLATRTIRLDVRDVLGHHETSLVHRHLASDDTPRPSDFALGVANDRLVCFGALDSRSGRLLPRRGCLLGWRRSELDRLLLLIVRDWGRLAFTLCLRACKSNVVNVNQRRARQPSSSPQRPTRPFIVAVSVE